MKRCVVVKVSAAIVLSASAGTAQTVPTWIPRAESGPVVAAVCAPNVECPALPQAVASPGQGFKWIGQGGLTLQANANPVANVEVAKYWIWATPTLSFPIMVASGLPISRASDGDDVIASILAEAGGMLNVRVGVENIKFLKKFWPQNAVYGTHADFYAGGKLTDAAKADAGASGDPNYIGLIEGRANLRLVLPITERARSNFEPTDLRGTLHLRLQTTYSRTTDETYRTLFGEATLLDTNLWSSSVSATLVITEVIYLETGWIFHMTDGLLKEREGKRLTFSLRMLR
jgi:hypothetical protein